MGDPRLFVAQYRRSQRTGLQSLGTAQYPLLWCSDHWISKRSFAECRCGSTTYAVWDTIAVYDTQNQQQIPLPIETAGLRINVVFGSDSKSMTSISATRALELWDIEVAQRIQTSRSGFLAGFYHSLPTGAT